MLPARFGAPYLRIMARLEPPDEHGCRRWPGAQNTDLERGLLVRYGSVEIGGRKGRVWGVHQVVYAYNCGPVPPGLVLDHLCRNVICGEIAHLEAVSQRTNLARSPLVAWTEERCANGHVRSEVGRDSDGRCTECRKARNRSRWQRRKASAA